MATEMESLYLLVRTSDSASARRQQGTAWLLWPDLVATALHVVGVPGGAGQWAHENLSDARDAYSLRLPALTQGGPAGFVAIEPIVYDPTADVALLRLPKEALASLPAGAFAVLAPERPMPGDPWRAKGFPGFEAGKRALAVGGVVSYVAGDIANNTMQLFVDQGTSVKWGGISGSAAQNAWGEVIGVVAQTVEGIATCNAAPADAARRLVQLAGRMAQLEALFLERLGGLAADALVDVANALEWGWLPQRPEYLAAPAPFLARRIVQAGDTGMSRALAALPKPAAAAASAASAELETLVKEVAEPRPSLRDLDAALAALADAGGSLARALDLAPHLGDLSPALFPRALEALHDRAWLEPGPRSESAAISLSAAGAARVIRLDFARAALRVLRGADSVSEAALLAAVEAPPGEVRRAMTCAVIMGFASKVGASYFITDPGALLLDRRAVPPGVTAKERAT